ncbi:MAG: AMP-binding protein [Pseudomonadota bacterium]
MPSFARQLAAERPTEVALRDAHNELTWAEVDASLNRVANGLRRVDLGPAQRIAVFAENAVETALANLSGLLASASVVPVNFHLTAEEVAYILTDSDARVVFCDAATLERAIDAAAESNVHLVISWAPAEAVAAAMQAPAVQTGSVRLTTWQDWLLGNPDEPADESLIPRPNLLYTSGTTGRPKGTPLPPTMFAGGATLAEHFSALAESPLKPYGNHLVVGPMYHTGPLSGARLLAAGVCSTILGRFDARETLAAIERFEIGSTIMVPTHFVRLLALPEEVRTSFDLNSLKRVSHTGAKCPVDVKRAMIDWWGPVFVDAYGASEVGTTCMIESEDWLRFPGSVGQAVPPFEAMILDDDNQPVPANTEGQLFFRDQTGRGVVYHNAPEKTAAAHIAPGVFTLGEIAYMNEEGYVFITDRFSDMVVSGGVNIYPAEAEQVLIEHETVADIACIGVPHPEMGEELKALVILEGGVQQSAEHAATLIAWCRDRLSHYKCPRSVDFVTDLGRNTMGKVNKRKLKAPYWEGQTA